MRPKKLTISASGHMRTKQRLIFQSLEREVST